MLTFNIYIPFKNPHFSKKSELFSTQKCDHVHFLSGIIFTHLISKWVCLGAMRCFKVKINKPAHILAHPHPDTHTPTHTLPTKSMQVVEIFLLLLLSLFFCINMNKLKSESTFWYAHETHFPRTQSSSLPLFGICCSGDSRRTELAVSGFCGSPDTRKKR